MSSAAPEAAFEWFVKENTDKSIVSAKWPFVFDLSSSASWEFSKTWLSNNSYDLPTTSNPVVTEASADSNVVGVALFGATNTFSNYCFISVDTSITEIEAVAAQLTKLLDSFVQSLTSSGGGDGTFSQLMNSIMSVMDVIMLGFVGAGITGFIVLIL